MTSSDSDEQPLTFFKGSRFLVHGPHAGWTRGRISNLIESLGGKMSDLEDEKLSHVIVGPQTWSKPDLTLKSIQKANEENRTEADENYNRVWLMDLAWVQKCVEEKKKLKEVKYDLERNAEKQKAAREQDRKEQLREEKKMRGGKSKYGRGERVRAENEAYMAKELKEFAELEKAGLVNNDADAFSGALAGPSTAPFPPLLADKPSTPAQPKLSFSPPQKLGGKAGTSRLVPPLDSTPKAVPNPKPKPKKKSRSFLLNRVSQLAFAAVPTPATKPSAPTPATMPPGTTLSIKPRATSSTSGSTMFGASRPVPKTIAISTSSAAGSDSEDEPLMQKVKADKGKAKATTVPRDYTSDSSIEFVGSSSSAAVGGSSSSSGGGGKRGASTSTSVGSGSEGRKRSSSSTGLDDDGYEGGAYVSRKKRVIADNEEDE
ncbi:hypothetical protein JCM8547_000875 [Rhodosporidiobolus lusitaniae]